MTEDGRPLLLGNMKRIRETVRSNCDPKVTLFQLKFISAATGILTHHNKSLLQRIDLSKTWAESVLNRMSLVRRKSTKTARTIPADFSDLKNNFLEQIPTLIAEHDIPEELVLIWDKKGVPIVLGVNGKWTNEAQSKSTLWV